MSGLTVKKVAGHVVINFHDVKTELVDAQDMHRHHPDTFDAPDFDTIVSMAIEGVFVKLGCGGERFWCRIVYVFDEGDPESLSFLGIVNNDLLMTGDHGLSMGDLVYFKACNILDIVCEFGGCDD